MSRKWSKHQYYQIFIFNSTYIFIGEVHISFPNDQVYFYCLPNLYIYLWPENLQNHVPSFSEITMESDWWLLILRNHSQWKIVQWSRRSWKSCIPVWEKVYYVFLFLKVSQCKFKQKETILKLGNTLKSKSKFTKAKIGWSTSTSTPYQGFTLNPFWLSTGLSLRR
jgi:hypothetical protein